MIGELSPFDGAPFGDGPRGDVRSLAEMSRSEFDALAAASPDLARRLLFDLGRTWRSGARRQGTATVAGVN